MKCLYIIGSIVVVSCKTYGTHVGEAPACCLNTLTQEYGPRLAFNSLSHFSLVATLKLDHDSYEKRSEQLFGYGLVLGTPVWR